MQRGDAWRPVAELLPERYPSALLDHREHSFEGRLREIAAAGEGRVLAGYSLGGRLALRAALREPGRYGGLVTVSTTAGIDEPTAHKARAEADERLAAWIEASPIEDVVSVWERQPLFADQSDALVEEQRPGRLSHDPAGLALLLRTASRSGTSSSGWSSRCWRSRVTATTATFARRAGSPRRRHGRGRRSCRRRGMRRSCSGRRRWRG
mgnify:CR=1 FL=1